MTYRLTFDLIIATGWLVFDWKSGSGGEHYYATIFCIELNNLIICCQIGKVCMSIEIRIIKINAEILFYYLKLYHQPFGWIVVAVTPMD